MSGPAGEATPISRQLSNKLIPLMIVVGCIIAFSAPVVYYVLESRTMREEAGLNARNLAEQIARLAAVSPELWKYQATKYAEILDRFDPQKEILGISVLDERGRPVSQYEIEPEGGGLAKSFRATGKPAPILFNNRSIGEVRVTVSTYPVLIRMLVFFFICTITGTGLSLVIYLFPVRVVSRLEQQNLDYQRTLEEKIHQRTSALRKAYEEAQLLSREAQAANRAKSQFLANMSHEIRTPMNGVLGMAQLLQTTALSGKQRKYLDTLCLSGENLLAVINDILDISKIEAGKIQIESMEFDLKDLVELTAGQFAGQAKNKGLQFICKLPEDVPAILRGDPTRIRQVLSNLLSNAVKFTKSGRIVLTLATEKRDEESVLCRFEVSDTGIGIPDTARERLFDSFTQADQSITRRFGGTGLGLAICKQLCGLMGGEIAFETEQGRGSTFKFTVPLKAARD